jgi:hypothetical protein
VNAGDIIIMAICASTSDTDMVTYTSWPAGFTEGDRITLASSGHQLAWAWGVAAGTEGGTSLTASWNDVNVNASAIAAVVMAFSGAKAPSSSLWGIRARSAVNNMPTPDEQTGTNIEPITGSAAAGSVEVMLVSLVSGPTGSMTVTEPAGSTKHATAATALSANALVAIGTMDGTMSGQNDPRTWTWTGSYNSGGATILLEPAVTTPVTFTRRFVIG